MRVKTIYLFIIIFLISGLLFADNIAESKSLYDKATVLVKQGKTNTAIPILRKSIKLNPNNFWAKKMLVDILSKKGEKLYNSGYQKTAYQYFKEAVKYWSNHPTAAFWYRKLKAQEGKLQNKPQIDKKKEEPKKDISKKTTDTKVLDKKPADKKVIDKKTTNKRTIAKSNVTRNTYRRNTYRRNTYRRNTYRRNTSSRKKSTKNIVLTEKQFKHLLKLQNKKEIIELPKKQPLLSPDILRILIGVLGLFLIITVFAFIRKGLKGHFGSKSRKKFRLDAKNAETIKILRDLIKVQKMDELVAKIESGELDWNVIKQYLGELDRKIRIEILSIIENKVYRDVQPISHNQAELLMYLLIDEDDYIRKKSNLLLGRSIVNLSNTTQLAAPDNTNPSSTPAQEVYQSEHKRRQSDYFLDTADLKGLIPLAKIVDKKVFSNNHSTNVAQGAYQIGVALGYSPAESNLFFIAGLAHNIGYLDIPSALFNKQEKLSEEELDTMQQHPRIGLELLDFTTIPQVLADGILYHHERWDGTGYPEGLMEKEIPIVARAIAIMDVYYALVSSRPYRPAKSKKEAVALIKELKEKVFDPKIVEIFNFLIKQNVL